MAEELRRACKIYLHRVNNVNAAWTQMTAATNAHMAGGFLMPNAATADCNWCLVQPVPAGVKTPPAGKIKIRWVTTSADTTNTVRFAVKCLDIIYNTTSVDGAFDDDLSVVAASAGQYIENECEVSLSSTSVVAGRGIRGLLERDPAHASDTLGADIWVTEMEFVADQA